VEGRAATLSPDGRLQVVTVQAAMSARLVLVLAAGDSVTGCMRTLDEA
jgi:hypothetical protein